MLPQELISMLSAFGRIIFPDDVCHIIQFKFRKSDNLLGVSHKLEAYLPYRDYKAHAHFFVHVTLTLNPSPRGRDLPSP